MKRTFLALILVSAAVSPFLAQVLKEPLADLIQAGKAKAALASIQAGSDVNQAQPDGTTPLLWAVSRANHEVLEALIAKKANVNVKNEFGVSPLYEAARQGDSRMVKALLDAGATVDSANDDGETALMVAIKAGDLESVKMLVDKGANVKNVEKFHNQTPLMYAAAANRNAAEMVKLLLSKGADVKPRSLFTDWESQVTSEPRTQYRSTGGLDALQYAVRDGCFECVEMLVAAGADVNRPTPEGVTPLMNAIDNEHNEVAQLLLDKGANPHVWDWWGRTALYIAVDMRDRNEGAPAGGGGQFGGFGGGGGAGKGKGGGAGKGGFGGPAKGAPAALARPAVSRLDLIKTLLDMGVNPNCELNQHRPNGPGRGRFGDNQLSTGTTPLFRAAQVNDLAVINLLLAHGANPNINSRGYSAYLLVAGVGPGGRGGNGGGVNQEAMEAMLQHGADPNAKVSGTYDWSFNVSRQYSTNGRSPAANEGMSALHTAAQSGRVDTVKYLLEKGADPNLLDAKGRKPIDLAVPAGRGGGAPGGPAPLAQGQAKGKGGPGGPGGGRAGAPAGPSAADYAEIRTLLQNAAAKK